MDLMALLLTPVQQLPRYRLLLFELLKEPDFCDPKLQSAMETLEDVLNSINTKRQNLMLAKRSLKLVNGSEETSHNNYKYKSIHRMWNIII